MENTLCDPLFWCHDAGCKYYWYEIIIWTVIVYCDFWAGIFVLVNGLCISWIWLAKNKCWAEIRSIWIGTIQNGLWGWRHLPCHSPRHHYFPHNGHVSNHVIGHVIIAIYVITMSPAMPSSMSWMCDMAIEFVTKIILFVMFIFVIENGFGLGFGGPGTFDDGFKMSWIKQFVTKF